MRKDELFNRLPPEWPADLMPEIRSLARASGRAVVVLDDDPTGTQTVANLPVLTRWDKGLLDRELEAGWGAFYILTNSRSLPLEQATRLNRAIADALAKAAKRSRKEITVISRSDSTLRGHFPGELEALESVLGRFDGWVLVPFFEEGGRYTIDDIHYAAHGEELVPAGETEFAVDRAFGYRASNLREWVQEKTGGAVRAEDVVSITLEALRRGGPEAVTRQLLALEGRRVIAANAASYRDVEVLALALRQAEAAGRRYLYRTAASFARVYAGLERTTLLTRASLPLPPGGAGLIVVGSYVPRTTAQLKALFEQTSVARVELSAARLIDGNTRDEETARAAAEVDEHLRAGRDTALYTSRALLSVPGARANLTAGKLVSSGLVGVIQAVQTRPRYLVAKGGITSSDLATGGLGIRRAMVLGQILPGVPVWQAGEESRYPGLVYVVFPGNVGDEGALAEIARALSIR